ncbi:hypothetical protein SAMN05660235_02812 [Sporolituus thermophilus DSM 23256]|uniref:Uncharacterized protein n=1 Tax=Sporolituus thermophilus DSM 23256 TaxID=1123285 RepID=A0A1G7P2R9_9FIRM|nr:hypothetical protein SAMN05660235_02812 [Sporolituus thermophilus DSM 23256]
MRCYFCGYATARLRRPRPLIQEVALALETNSIASLKKADGAIVPVINADRNAARVKEFNNGHYTQAFIIAAVLSIAGIGLTLIAQHRKNAALQQLAHTNNTKGARI